MAFAIYVKASTKERLIKSAADHHRSLSAEVVLMLLERYQPDGWEAVHADVVARTRLFNNRAEVLGGGQEAIGLYFPPCLRAAVEQAARRARRSINSEITMFLEGGKDD